MITGSTSPRMSRIKNIVFLRPYGTNLLTPGAANWLFIARIIVLLMASSEAISWGYLGGLFFNNELRYVSAAIAGSFVFLIIWGVDVSLMTLDRARPFYETALYNKTPGTRWRELSKEAGAFITRWFIVITSLVITAPFLAQIIFGVDIRKEIEGETTQIVKAARANIEGTHAKAIQDLESSLKAKRNQLTEEVAGRLRSGSGLYGEGPVARTIKEQIAADEASLDKLRTTKDSEIKLFDQTVANKNYDELRNRWGVVLPENSVIKRGEVLAKIVQVPTYTKTEWAIKAFLAFLFLSLFILKLFEPRSIKLYLSEALQQEWSRYKAGAFDAWLSNDEKSAAVPSSMTPFRFEDLMINVYPAVRAEDMTRRQSAKVEEEAKDGLGRLGGIKAEILAEVKAELGAAQTRLTELNKEISALLPDKEKLTQEVSNKKKDVLRYEDGLKDFDPVAAGVQGQTAEIQTVKMKALRVEAEAILLSEMNKLEEMEVQLSDSERRLNALYEERKEVESRVSHLERGISLVNKGIEEIRMRRIEDAVSRGKGKVN